MITPASLGQVREFDAVVCALDVPGIKGVLPPNFRQMDFFDKIYKLETVPIATVQVRSCARPRADAITASLRPAGCTTVACAMRAICARRYDASGPGKAG